MMNNTVTPSFGVIAHLFQQIGLADLCYFALFENFYNLKVPLLLRNLAHQLTLCNQT